MTNQEVPCLSAAEFDQELRAHYQDTIGYGTIFIGFDLDNLKALNTYLGYDNTNRVIAGFVAAVQSCTRNPKPSTPNGNERARDLLGRSHAAGDEFILAVLTTLPQDNKDALIRIGQEKLHK